MMFKAGIFAVLTIFLTNASCKVSLSECPNIPGWITAEAKGRWLEAPGTPDVNVTDAEAEKNGNDLSLRPCCDYKKKCSFTMEQYFENATGQHGQTCGYNADCSDIDSGILRIRRKWSPPFGTSWSGQRYCGGFGEGRGSIFRSACAAFQNCISTSKTSEELLPCLNRDFSEPRTSFGKPGFFTAGLFPYKVFTYKQVYPTKVVEFVLGDDGKIVQTTKTN